MIKNISNSSTLKVLPHKKIVKTNQTLLINQQTNSWCIIENKIIPLLKLINGKKFSDLNFPNQQTNPVKKILQHLYEYGLISIDNQTTQKNPQPSLEEKNLFAFMVLKITNKCNLKCKYCYNNEKENFEYQNQTKPLKAIQAALNYSDKGLNIALHGGEPLLRFDLIQKIVQQAKKKAKTQNKELNFFIQTNGTLLNNEIIQFIKTNKMGLGISLDGPPQINDKNRITPQGQGSYTKIINNLKQLQKSNVTVNILTVVTAHNARHLGEIVRFFEKEGFKSIKFSYFFTANKNNTTKTLYPSVEDLTFGFKDIIQSIQKKQIWNMHVDNLTTYIRNILLRDGFSMCDRSPCGAARDMIAIYPSGNIYSCDCLVTPDFKLGNINQTNFENLFNTPITKKLSQRQVNTLKSCKNCYLKHICGGTMTCRAYWASGSLNSVDPIQCQVNKKIIEHLMWNLVEGSELMEYFFRHNPDNSLQPAKFHLQ